jgi:hypothetical protein
VTYLIIKRWFILLCITLLGGRAVVHAAEVSFSASVDQTEIGLNDTLMLTLSLQAPDLSQATDFQRPNLGSLQIVNEQQQESLSFNFINGQQQVRKLRNTILVVRPTAEGTVTIGPARIKYQGKIFATDPITVRVVKDRPQSSRPKRRPFGMNPFDSPFDDFFRSPMDRLRNEPVEISEADVFVEATISPDVVVEGQQTAVTLGVYSRINARIKAIRWPKLEEFFTVDRDVSDLQVEEKILNGIAYQYKVLDRKALFPLQPGARSIEPVEVEIDTGTSPFFAGQTRTIRTKPLKLRVEPLPSEGQPKEFHPGNIGHFELSAAVDALAVSLNQPVTYTLTVRGSGNIQQLRPPELPPLDKVKRFDPTVDIQIPKKGREVKGSKTFEYILMPLASGELTIPALAFSFYDPTVGAYRTLSTESFTITVAASETTAQPGEEGTREVNLVAGAFKPIRFESTLSGYGQPFYRSNLFIPLLIAPVAMWLLLIFMLTIRARLQANSPRLRMRRAAIRARQRLRRTKKLLATGNAADFYAELKLALLDALEARNGLPLHGVRLDKTRILIEESGATAEVAEAVVREIENCDFGRFAPANSRGDEMQAASERVKRLVNTLARQRRARPIREGKL